MHRCLVTWSEEPPFGFDEQVRHNRYVELHHLGSGLKIPLAVIHKPDPLPFEDGPPERDIYAGLPRAHEPSSAATFNISFRKLSGEIRPWFDIFQQELFPPGIEPELVVEARSRGFTLELILTEGEFVSIDGSKPRIRFFDAFGWLPGPAKHIHAVGLSAANRLVMRWTNPEEETVTSFDVLCRYRGDEIWLDPAIYTKGIGSLGL